ncbi:MAG: discoidin domain-containing protein [Betaproteobacteria bacterium]|nr:MAG: discoidin domain-containing protein [Betaproteobacteria bacterium]
MNIASMLLSVARGANRTGLLMKRFHSICIALSLLVSLSAFAADRVLFIRGGDGTGGFLEGGSNDQLSDIDNFNLASGNHGWAELASLLRGEGYVLTQLKEGAATVGADLPVDLVSLDLTPYKIIVFGSNNATYGVEAVNKIEAFVRSGGGVLFISDANFGSNWGDAPSSDQPFLDRFGLIMNQDAGTYALDRALGDYLVAAHPILVGVNKFDGEGVSPISINTAVTPVGVLRTRLAAAKGQVRIPNGVNQGTTGANTTNDGSLVVAEAGSGRFAGHFDRNTFFNRGGAGTDITRFDNRVYARNLFAWLSQRDRSPRLDRTGWTATASTPANSAQPVTAALDGDVFTRWATGQPQAAGQTFTLDMKELYSFDRVVMEAGANQNDYPRGYEISSSVDGNTWQQVGIGAQLTATTDVSFGRQFARYLRVRQTGTAASNNWSIAEINVFRADGSCSLDMNGDSQLNATNEGLVLLRAMLGLKDSAVTSGTGVSAAQWASARPLLNLNCGTRFAP